MKLFHTTTKDAAKAILSDGFRDSESNYLTTQMWKGVWFSHIPVGANEGAKGNTLLVVEAPTELFEKYEWIDESGFSRYREAMIPADEINQYPVRVATEEEEMEDYF